MTDQSEIIEISDPSALPANPLVSVYTLAYKHEKFIADAIDGVIAQQCDFPIELIIGEDCSPDRTREIAVDYQRRYPQLIRVLISERNVGAYANEARCRKAARGEFIAICEGDDYWHYRKKLQLQVELMRSSPNTTMCHTDYDRQIGRRIKKNCHQRNQTKHLAVGNAYGDLLHTQTVMTVTCMYRTAILREFETTEFNNPTWPFGDTNSALYASVRGSIGYLPASTATWRKVRGSASNASPKRMLQMRLAGLACREMFMSRYPVDNETRRNCLLNANRKILNSAFVACNLENYDEAIKSINALGVQTSRLRRSFIRTCIRTKLPILVVRAARNAILRLTT